MKPCLAAVTLLALATAVIGVLWSLGAAPKPRHVPACPYEITC